MSKTFFTKVLFHELNWIFVCCQVVKILPLPKNPNWGLVNKFFDLGFL